MEYVRIVSLTDFGPAMRRRLVISALDGGLPLETEGPLKTRIRMNLHPDENCCSIIIEALPDGDPGIGVFLTAEQIPGIIDTLQEYSVALSQKRKPPFLRNIFRGR